MVAVSEDIARFLCQAVGVKPDKIRTIYNGIETDLFCPNQRMREQIRQELQVTDEQSVIGAVGNLYPVKGHTYLVRAAATVTEVVPNAVFLIAGRGHLLGRLQAEARELGVENKIRFLGFRDDVPALLQAMDIFVLPSLSEGLPLSAIEAMASGKPVVATRVGGVPEVVVDGETGFLVAPEDAGGLAKKLVCLLKSPCLAQELGSAGCERAKERFSLDRMVKGYEELYDAALLGKA
jgi:glycosyltransferase involved in cell wall biosynthesis